MPPTSCNTSTSTHPPFLQQNQAVWIRNPLHNNRLRGYFPPLGDTSSALLLLIPDSLDERKGGMDPKPTTMPTTHLGARPFERTTYKQPLHRQDHTSSPLQPQKASHCPIYQLQGVHMLPSDVDSTNDVPLFEKPRLSGWGGGTWVALQS